MRCNCGRCGPYTMFVRKIVSESVMLFWQFLKTWRSFSAIRYCKMLCEEQGEWLLEELMYHKDTHPDIRLLLTEILEVLGRHVK